MCHSLLSYHFHGTEALGTPRCLRHGRCPWGGNTQNIHETRNHLVAGFRLSYSIHPYWTLQKKKKNASWVMYWVAQKDKGGSICIGDWWWHQKWFHRSCFSGWEKVSSQPRQIKAFRKENYIHSMWRTAKELDGESKMNHRHRPDSKNLWGGGGWGESLDFVLELCFCN